MKAFGENNKMFLTPVSRKGIIAKTYGGNLQSKTINVTQNGTITIGADSTYDALSEVTINTNVPGLVPTGNINITSTAPVDVTQYATATIVDANLLAKYIKKGITILGVTGTYDGSGGESVIETASTSLSSGAYSISFTGLTHRPVSFVVIANSDLSPESGAGKIETVVFDGTNTFGTLVTNTSGSQATYDSSSFTYTYSDGTLTVISTNTPAFYPTTYSLISSYGDATYTQDVQVGSGATSIKFTGLTSQPKYFSCVFKGNFGTSSGYARAQSIAGANDGIMGFYMNSKANNSTSAWTASYSSGTFTIRSSSNSNGGYFHQPGYYQLTYSY